MSSTIQKITDLRSQLWLAASLLILSLGVLANETPEQTQPDFDNLTSPKFFLKAQNSHHDAPLLDTSVDIAVSGMVAKVLLTQSFSNTSTEWVEGLYTFPLPDKAAVNSLVVTIGDRRIVGSIREKKQAEKLYQQAKSAGKVASLVKQHRPNLFSSKFANIAPGETVSIELGYVQTISYDSNQYSLRVPLTLTPRYSNTLVGDKPEISPPIISKPNAGSLTTLHHEVKINTRLFGLYEASQVDSPSHDLIISPADEGTDVVLNETAYLDRDFILQWRDVAQGMPLVQAWRENVAGEEYLLATITPPVNEALIPEQARELILVIDTSGSMAGESMRAAKAALLDALSGLNADDSFNIIEFDSDFRTLFKKPKLATEEHITLAENFTANLIADGGTEMLGALKTALRYKQSGLLRQVIFITDGAVGYEENVFESVTGNLGDARLFTVGIGAAPNQWFMRKVAEAGRGTHQLIHNISDVQNGMSQLLRKLEAPALTGIDVSFDGGKADIAPNPVPDLYAKEPLIIAAKLADDNHTMSVSGTWGTALWSTKVSVDNAPLTNTGLSTVWAKKKIELLQDKQRFNTDPEIYRSLILRLSLDHQVLSPYTAFLAVDEQPLRPAYETLRKKTVPNLLPKGSAPVAIPLPQGASGTDTLLLMSLLLMLIALMLFGYGGFSHKRIAQSEEWINRGNRV